MEGLGIDIKILLGQIITFIVLLAILKKYAYKPFLSIMEQRAKKIEEGVKKSEEAEVSLQKIRALGEEIREKGEKKAKEIVVAAETKAQEKAKAIQATAEVEKTKVIEGAKAAMAKEQEAARDRQQKEALDLAMLVSEKFLKEKITKEQDKKMLESLAAELE
jgi:F-type H+-transporting ATPase subunit b